MFRTHSDEGDWSGNLYDFYYKVINRIDDDIAVPFVNRKDGYRVDRVDVHAALGRLWQMRWRIPIIMKDEVWLSLKREKR